MISRLRRALVFLAGHLFDNHEAARVRKESLMITPRFSATTVNVKDITEWTREGKLYICAQGLRFSAHRRYAMSTPCGSSCFAVGRQERSFS
jgi:hypothetical protein